MIRVVPYPVLVRSRPSMRRPVRSPYLLWLAVTALLAVATAAAAGSLALRLWTPGIDLSLADGSRDVPLHGVVSAAPRGWAARIESATLHPATAASTGMGVAVRVDSIRRGWLPESSEDELRPVSGALKPDTEYTLKVRASALAAALPLPRRETVERAVRFTTPPSPRPLAQVAPVRLRWGEPLAIRWSTPVAELDYDVSPPLASRAWVDEADGRITFVALEDAEEARSYRVVVTGAVGKNGMRLQQAATYSVVPPARPRLVAPEGPVTAEVGRPIPLRWSEPLRDLRLAISPDAEVAWSVDPQDPSGVVVRLGEAAQGSRYELTILEAVAQNGAPLAEPRTVVVDTPPALEISEFLTGGGRWALTTVKPTIVFSEPIRDRPAAEAAIELDPAVAGRFEWLDDATVRFAPSRPLPYNMNVTLSLRPGPGGARSANGGYLEESAAFSFRTIPNKTIDVDVTRQSLVLLEGDRAVRRFVVSTGLPGADTPIGEFRVQYKMPSAHFRGVNSASGTRYDLANVNWVLAFMGDYTIHGAYWRQAFGAPGSNGCVSLADADAKAVYDWAPEGTLIRIHY